MSKVFIDTNILIYCLDQNDLQKQERARKRLRKVVCDGNGVISTQVLQEFFVTATRKLDVAPLQAKEMMQAFRHYETVAVTPQIINHAIDCCILNRISFWDALIVSAAESAKCDIILTEDLNNGQMIQGIQIENPFISP